MEYYLHTCTVEKHEYGINEMPLGLSDAWWGELAFHYENQNECWQRVSWCYDNGIPFTIRGYRMYSEEDSKLVENQLHYDWAMEEMTHMPCPPMDWVFWFINIPDEKHALMYKLVWVT